MPMNMDQMNTMMAQMHAQNYQHNMQLAQHFQSISAIFTEMAQGDYKMYQYHQNQSQGAMQPMPVSQTQSMY